MPSQHQQQQQQPRSSKLGQDLELNLGKFGHLAIWASLGTLLLLQVASLFVWFSTVAGFYALEVPMLPSVAWQAATAVLYSGCTVAVFCAYFKVR